MSEDEEPRVVDLTPGGKPVTHGKPATYNYGCRCEGCKASNLERMSKQRTARYSEGLKPGDLRHGTLNGYKNYQCRCDKCRFANSESSKDQRSKGVQARSREKAIQRFKEGEEVKHGAYATYIWFNCRCEPCKEASKRQREKRIERASRGEIGIPHGTLNGYNNYRCRCEECVNAKKQYGRGRRKK